MQHVRHPNVFSLGDVSSTPNSKTAAAVRKQAPVVVDNILHMMGKTAVEGGYLGWWIKVTGLPLMYWNMLKGHV
jgi:sulfide:quinone oxidoreductase